MDVVLDSTQLVGLISRVHAHIEVAADASVILRDSSLNGVRVGNKLLRRTQTSLSDGDVIIFGAKAKGAETEFRYVAYQGECCDRQEASQVEPKRARLEPRGAPAGGEVAASTPGFGEAGGVATEEQTKCVAPPLETGEEVTIGAEAAPHGDTRDEGATRTRTAHTEVSATTRCTEKSATLTCANTCEADASQRSGAVGAASQSSIHADVEDEGEEAESIMYEELQCIVCKELLCRPHMLQCSHTFCADCLFSWAQRDRNCILCRQPMQQLPQLVRQLDALTSKLASAHLVDAEQADWLARAAAWDARAAEARSNWLVPPEKPPPPEREIRVLVEYCASSRSTCRRCLRRIGLGDLRCGVESWVPMFGSRVVAWHHSRCLALARLVRTAEELHGFETLNPRDQARLRKAVAAHTNQQ